MQDVYHSYCKMIAVFCWQISIFINKKKLVILVTIPTETKENVMVLVVDSISMPGRLVIQP